MITYCACGQPLHYADLKLRREIEQTIARTGAELLVACGQRTWIVPRHYLALHPTKPIDLPNLRFPEVLDHDRTFLPYKFDDGGTIVDPHNRDYNDQIYSHLDTDGRDRHFHITKLQKLILESLTNQGSDGKAELGVFPVDRKNAASVAGRCSLDESHLGRLSAADVDKPGIICLFDDNAHLIVDGNHRYIKRYRLKKDTMEFWIAPEAIWRRTLLAVPLARW